MVDIVSVPAPVRCVMCEHSYARTVENWYPNSAAPSGWHSYCRACRRELSRRYWRLNYSKEGRLRREEMLNPTDFVELRSEVLTRPPLYIIYTGGGLAIGHIHEVVVKELPAKYQHLSRLGILTTTDTNYRKYLNRMDVSTHD